MISHKHQCIFIHIPKCAGTSVEKMFLTDLNISYQHRLSLFMGRNDDKIKGPPRLAHLTISEMIENHLINLNQLDNYYSFAVIRNPIDRIFSFYKYLGYNEVMNLNNFITKVVVKSFITKDSNYWFLKPQKDYLIYDGKVIVKKLIVLEKLSNEVDNLKLQVKLNKTLELTHENKSGKSNPILKSLKLKLKYFHFMDSIFWYGTKKKQTISKENLKILKQLYKEDFELYNFQLSEKK